MYKLRFHILGSYHTRTSREVSVDAFAQKTRLLCKMLYDEGHHVIHYGIEGSNPVCTENVDVVCNETFAKVHEVYDYKRPMGFETGTDNDCYREYEENAVAAISARQMPGDFLLCPYGWGNKPVADRLKGLIVVESGIGYDATFAQFRVFESYAWMHYHYGKEGKNMDPSWYDAVIPNYLDMDDYPYYPDKDDYFMFLGRPTPHKGLDIAGYVCNHIGAKLYAAGQGNWVPDGVEATHLGVLSIEERAEWVGHAKALFVPTYYIEPFGTVNVEAAAYGTPVIATDFGVFPETVIHGVTGYRCRTFEQFVWAARNIDRILPRNCRKHAYNFSLETVRKMYSEYFDMLHVLHQDERGWMAFNEGRTELDWLRRG